MSSTLKTISLLPLKGSGRNPQEMLKNRINEIRAARGLTFEELAERADMSPSFVSLMARGKRNVSLKNLEKLARALDCQPEDLIGVETTLPSDVAAIWASIPPDRRDLALHVLQSFTTIETNTNESAIVDTRGEKNRKPVNQK